VAVGEFELVHTITDLPPLFVIPKTPHYCQQVMYWQNQIVPVMNLAARFLPPVDYSANDYESDTHRLGALSIFTYQHENTQSINYGALLLHSAPKHCEVSDIEQCALPVEFAAWKYYMISCFKNTQTQKAIPIIRLERLFATPTWTK
jgi:hypothetical protein